MLHYILDGYNVVHRSNKLSHRSLEKCRERLVRFIKKERPQGSLKNKVTIVFDGNPEVDGFVAAERSSALSPYPIEVIYTHTMSADDFIVRLVQKADHPKAVVVVSDDKEVRDKTRLLGAKILSVQAFLGIKKQPRRYYAPDKPELTYEEEKEIADELKKTFNIDT